MLYCFTSFLFSSEIKDINKVVDFINKLKMKNDKIIEYLEPLTEEDRSEMELLGIDYRIALGRNSAFTDVLDYIQKAKIPPNSRYGD